MKTKRFIDSDYYENKKMSNELFRFILIGFIVILLMLFAIKYANIIDKLIQSIK